MNIISTEFLALKQSVILKILVGVTCEQTRKALENHLSKLHSSFLIADDIIDNASKRHEQPCWHTLVGSTALNDAMLLDTCVDQVVHLSSFTDATKYSLLNAIHQARTTTCLGQNLDIKTMKITEYSWDRYFDISRMKTSHYSFLLPVQLAFIAAEKTLPENISSLMLQFGYYFQAQDDYLDYHGKPSAVGKTCGLDILEGKCTWTLLTAIDLAKGKSDDKVISQLDEYYGKATGVDKVLNIYEKLGLESAYNSFELTSQTNLQKELENLALPLKNVFTQLLHRLKLREK